MHRRTFLAALAATAALPLAARANPEEGGREENDRPAPTRLKVRKYTFAEIDGLPRRDRRKLRRLAFKHRNRKPPVTVGPLTPRLTILYLDASLRGSVKDLNGVLTGIYGQPNTRKRKEAATRARFAYLRKMDLLRAKIRRIEQKQPPAWRVTVAPLKAELSRLSAGYTVLFNLPY